MKVIPLFYIKKTFGNNFKCYSNLDYKLRNKVLLPKFYRKILSSWMINFTTPPELPSSILNQFLWYNKYVRINKITVYVKRFSEHNLNFMIDSEKFRSWHIFKTEYNLNHKFHFQWLEVTDSIPKAWKNIVQKNINNNGPITIKDHHIMRRTRIFSINKLTVRKLYSTLMSNIENKPTSQIYFQKMFLSKPIKWDEINLLPRRVTYNTCLRCVQFKILNNIL